MVSQRLFSISSVFGGKNSKEIAGCFSPRSVAGGVTSVMALTSSATVRQHQVGFGRTKIGHQSRTKQPITDGKLPNLLSIYPIIMSISPFGGQAESVVDSRVNGLFISNSGTFCVITVKPGKGGQGNRINKRSVFGPPPGRPGIPRRQRRAHDRGYCGFGSPH